MSPTIRRLLPVAAAALALASCAGGARNPLARERVVREERQPLADGESALFTLASGKYRVEVETNFGPFNATQNTGRWYNIAVEK